MLLLRNIAQTVTLRGGSPPRAGASISDPGIIENGALLIHGNRIVWVGHTQDIPVRDPGTLEEDKQADIMLMDVSDYRELPYFSGVNHCVVSIKKGNIFINRLEQH